MKRIVQCVPNFSEGKDVEKIERIVEPLKNQEGFKLVSYEADKDYNRTVVTLIGDPESMFEPLLNFIKRAIELIDMNEHQGEHARMGAVDVLPFIPIENMTMDECVNIAHDFGKKVTQLCDYPVFLYAEAAQVTSRKKLPNIRKGEFEGMKEKIKDPKWKPDYGNAEIHPTAGVIGIGARLPLIAYNIDLATEDIDVAKAIAKAIRGSSGGFKHVQAGPVYLEERGHVQVTMNILNYKQNPIYRVLETVKMEAKRYLVDVPSSEIVGLIPKDAIVRSLRYYYESRKKALEGDLSLEKITQESIDILGFRDFKIDKIIEANLS